MKSATAVVATLVQTVWAQNPSCSPTAVKVKVQSTTGAPLTIRELRIFSDSINVAIGKNATQSSDLDGTTDASKAVDGRWGTYSSTGEGCVKWLEVDLNEPVPIDKVLIVNRKCSDNPACGCQLSYAIVSLLDSNGDWVASKITQDTCNKGWVGFRFKKKCPTAAPTISDFPSLSPSSASSQIPSEMFVINWDVISTRRVCNGNGGSHGFSGQHTFLGKVSADECTGLCGEQGPGCCESRAFPSKTSGACIWKSDPSVGYSSGHTDTKATAI